MPDILYDVIIKPVGSTMIRYKYLVKESTINRILNTLQAEEVK